MELNRRVAASDPGVTGDKADFQNNFKVTPWEVEGDIDYRRLMAQFGTLPITSEIIEKIKKVTGEVHPLLKSQFFITSEIIEKIKKVTGEVHPLLKSQFFFSHRDLDWILNKYDEGESFYLYTGRGPSGMVHIGHTMPWLFTKYIQQKFGSKLLFQLTDDEKFLQSQDRSKKEIEHYVQENILDIIAIGFDPDKTKIIVDSRDIGHLYPLAIDIARKITFSTAKSVFGFSNSTNIGMIGFPPLQAAPCFLPSLMEGRPTPVLIPAAIDQDPYWRVTRDVAERLGHYKPAQIHSKFLPGLQQLGKMSSSKPESALLTTDDPDTLSKKVSTAFTGGQATISLQRMLGGNALGCPVFWYLRYLFDTEKESDDRLLKCKNGNLLCGECKSDLTKDAQTFLVEYKRRREKARDIADKFTFKGAF